MDWRVDQPKQLCLRSYLVTLFVFLSGCTHVEHTHEVVSESTDLRARSLLSLMNEYEVSVEATVILLDDGPSLKKQMPLSRDAIAKRLTQLFVDKVADFQDVNMGQQANERLALYPICRVGHALEAKKWHRSVDCYVDVHLLQGEDIDRLLSRMHTELDITRPYDFRRQMRDHDTYQGGVEHDLENWIETYFNYLNAEKKHPERYAAQLVWARNTLSKPTLGRTRRQKAMELIGHYGTTQDTKRLESFETEDTLEERLKCSFLNEMKGVQGTTCK